MEESEQVSRLFLHGEKTLPVPVRARLFACCPTMDLIAVVCQPAQLDVYRLNGQRAFGYQASGNEDVIESLCWKYNGQSIAIGWQSGNIDVVSAETGKVSQHVRKPTPGSANIEGSSTEAVAVLGWGLNLIDVQAVKAKTQQEKSKPSTKHRAAKIDLADVLGNGDEQVSLDDFLSRLPDSRLLDLDPNLPDHLALADPENQLPKLPTLPVLPANAGIKSTDNPLAEAFATQASLDALLLPPRAGDINGVDVLLRLGQDGTTLPVLYGSLALRPLRLPAGLFEIRPVLHAYNPLSSSHMILAETEMSARRQASRQFALLPLSLSFVRSASKHLQTVSSKAARIQALLYYTQACIDSLAYHWIQSQDLPVRLMRVISDTLEESSEMGLVPSLFHLAVTGHCPATIKEWLVEQLTERGHKRWDHAVSLGYSRIIEITHENLLPALDKCAMLLSSLRGVATYYQDTGDFDIPPRKMTIALDALQNLRVLSHHLLFYAGIERKQFASFSKWLRHEIDTQGADASAAEDDVERDAGVDYQQTLSYIRDTLSASKVRLFVSEILDGLPEIAAEDMTTETIAKHVEAMKEGGTLNQYALSMEAHFSLLKAGCDDIFDLVVQWQLAKSAYHMAILLREDKEGSRDMRVIFENLPGLPTHVTTYLAVVPTTVENQIRIYRTVHADTVIDRKSIESTSGAVIHFGSRSVRTVQFIDDYSLMAIVADAAASFLVQIDYHERAVDDDAGLSYFPLQTSNVNAGNTHADLLEIQWPPRTEPAEALDCSDWTELKARTRQSFSAKGRFRPGRLAINGRKDRRLVFILGEDGKHYKVFDLDNHDEGVDGRIASPDNSVEDAHMIGEED